MTSLCIWAFVQMAAGKQLFPLQDSQTNAGCCRARDFAKIAEQYTRQEAQVM
jgi:hypothetical protein